MIYSNISLGDGVEIDPSSSVNNIAIGDNVKIAKRVSAFGSKNCPLRIGKNSYIGMNSILNGYAAELSIGEYVSIAQNVNMMTDSGPNASEICQRIFPITHGAITIGDHSWIGASSIIMPGVTIGKFCVVAAGSFVKQSFPDFSIIGGTPARLIRKLNDNEIKELTK
ncbi:MAG TPA: transferase [Rikenellaceae bacterium]|nr:transferase [Rikenellaceae bacterium]